MSDNDEKPFWNDGDKVGGAAATMIMFLLLGAAFWLVILTLWWLTVKVIGG